MSSFFGGCCFPTFRLTSASLASDFFFFLPIKSENWGCSGTLGSAQSKLFSRTLLPLLLLEAAQGFVLVSAPSLLCRGGTPGFAGCAPLMWTRQEPCCIFFFSFFFLMMPLQSEVSFPFFSLGRSNLQPVCFHFPSPSYCYLPRMQLEYLCGAGWEPPALPSGACTAASQTAQEHPSAGPCCSISPFPLTDLSFRAAPESCCEQPPAVSITWAPVRSVMNSSSRA